MLWVAGVDEAGRGPLAGPVVAAAVILNPKKIPMGLDDSKKVSEKKRELLFVEIVESAMAWCIASASQAEIDRVNILNATLLAMQRAVQGLSIIPHHVKIDGNRCPSLPMSSEAIIGGDGSVPEISAASILAKVHRDRTMQQLHELYPVYGFDQHKGYGTAAHRQALQIHGPCPEHRRSFSPVAQMETMRTEKIEG